MNDSILKALGRVVVNFNSIEIYLSIFIWQLVGSGIEIGKIITSEIPFKGKVATFASLYRLKIGEIKKDSDINNLIKKLCCAEEDRNKILHSNWLVDEKNEKVTRYKISAKLKRGLKDEFEEINESDINKVASSIGDVSKELGRMFSQYLQANSSTSK